MDYLPLLAPYVDQLDRTATTPFAPCCCPFHDDEKPSAGISRESGVLNCQAGCGAFSAAQVIAKVSGITLNEASDIVEAYRTENGMIERADPPSNKSPIHVPRFKELMDISQAMMKPNLPIVSNYCRTRRVQYETLLSLGVGWLPASLTHWKRESLVFPYTYGGKVTGLRYRDIDSNKGGEEHGHHILWGIDDLDDYPNADTVLVTEGETDRVAAWEAFEGRLPVVSTATASFRREWLREFDGFANIILIPQDDEPSARMADKVKAFSQDVTVLQLPWRRRQDGKDISDWFKYNDHVDFRALVERLIDLTPKRVMTTNEFAKAAEFQGEPLIENMLDRRQVAIMAGPPKSYKTWLALNIVRCLLQPGSDFLQIPGLTNAAKKPQKVLFIEEEGSARKFMERVERVLEGTPYRENCFWGHHLGLKLDSGVWVDKLINEIERHEIDFLIIDPFQRTYTADENSATEMSIVWHQIASLTARFKRLSILILHHFNKSGLLSDRWNAIRGSNRSAGEVDLGIFVERRGIKDNRGSKIVIDGRDVEAPVNAQGEEILSIDFNGGIMAVDPTK